LGIAHTSLEAGLNTEEGTLTSDIAEKEAIRAARMGDADSFAALYALHRRHVYALCLRMTGNTADGEDLTQEVFMQLLRKINTFRGDSQFSTWLHRVTVNVVLMHMRRKSVPILKEELDAQQDDRPPREIGAQDKTLAFSIDRITLQRSVEDLPTGYRLIFMLHDVEGYQHNEIAQMMRCTVGNSKSQLHKARMKLRTHLQTRSAGRQAQHPRHRGLMAA
jgi:RNA polymerase sigma-70 factor, ECF subfamily